MLSQPAKPLYFKKLDALRFIAFFLVFWQHGFSLTFVNFTDDPDLKKIVSALTLTGGMGVHIFFVISGFLITFLMIKEQNESGKMNVKNFYLRRILRIWPLYYFVILLGMFVLPYLFKEFTFAGNIFNNLAFLNNFDMHNQSDNVGIAWSVAIEEQFYLFWPLLFIAFKNRKFLVLLCCLIFIGSGYFVSINSFPVSYYHTFSNLNYLMAGCLGAIFYTGCLKKPWVSIMTKRVFLYLSAMLAVALPVLENFSEYGRYVCLLFLPFIYLHIVICLVHREDDKPASSLSLLGKYTYGMYLYHPIILILVRIFFEYLYWPSYSPLQNFSYAVLSLYFTIRISKISYNYFEKHFLKLKKRFGAVETRI